ncbi:hypothetical protein D8S78_13260 [Natrialba swarupiae]|nr:hypothetical protein [Natrialba swarupiae]
MIGMCSDDTYLPSTVAEAEEQEWAAVERLRQYDGPEPDGLELASEQLLSFALLSRRRDRREDLRKHIRFLNATDGIIPPASVYALLNRWDPRTRKIEQRREMFEEEVAEIEEDIKTIREAQRNVRGVEPGTCQDGESP